VYDHVGWKVVEAVLFTPAERWSEDPIAAANSDVHRELTFWEMAIAGGYLAGALSAVDFTFYNYPNVALVLRIGSRKPGLVTGDLGGPAIGAWMRRMEALPVIQKTWPPRWKQASLPATSRATRRWPLDLSPRCSVRSN